MEKYRFYHDASVYISSKPVDPTGKGYTQGEIENALAYLVEFTHTKELVTKAKVKAKIAEIDDMDTPGPARVLFVEALEYAQRLFSMDQAAKKAAANMHAR